MTRALLMCRSVALGVAAAVAWTAKTDKVSSPAANDTLSCLFRADSPDISGLLVVAERCIGETCLYFPNPGASLQSTPSMKLHDVMATEQLYDAGTLRYDPFAAENAAKARREKAKAAEEAVKAAAAAKAAAAGAKPEVPSQSGTVLQPSVGIS